MRTPRRSTGAPGASLALALLLATASDAMAQLSTVTITASDPTADESGLETGAFTLTRTGGDLSAALSVGVTRGGTASNGFDYAFISSQILIPANQSSLVVLVTPLADNLAEGDETFSLTLDPLPTYEIGSPASATVTIADDPAIVTIAAPDPDADEAGPDPGTFRLSRTGGNLAAELTVEVVRGGSALNGSDYAFTSRLIDIPAGEPSLDVVITPLADNLVEGDERVACRSSTLSARRPATSYARAACATRSPSTASHRPIPTRTSPASRCASRARCRWSGTCS
jgi:hypothetical protein